MEIEGKADAFPLAKTETDQAGDDEDIGVATADVVQELWVFGEA